jgi:sialate O-acetylesterase
MAVATDSGDSLNIHPRNKTIIGERLAYWALAKDYGFKNVTFLGPVYKSMKINGKTIELSFDYAEKGLMVKGGDLKEFEIAGTDKQFYPANAVIRGKNVVVSSTGVVNPVYVRFAWKNFMHPNFYNQQGLPAVPFKTTN